ncbi:MAG: hypothetical protein ACREQ5_30065 [Candidatus Dormibacteria bacterium]
MPEPDAHRLVSAARDLMRIESARNAGLGPRAAAVLGRQALELAMGRVWAVTAPGMERMTMRCQRLCLGALLNDPSLGRRVEWTWHVLSDACHHGAYDLPPSAHELLSALETIWMLADSAERLRSAAAR